MNSIAFAHLLLASTMVAGGAAAQSAPQVVGLPPQPALCDGVGHQPPRTIGWPEGRKPVAPRGYEVVKFAGGLDYPRQALLLPNGDVIVAEARTKPKLDADPEVQRGQALSKATGFSANRLTLLRDADRDGVAEQRFVLREGLNQPFGMQYVGGRLYVANTDGVVSFPFQPGQTAITAAPKTLMALPAGGIIITGPATCCSAPMGVRSMSRSARLPMSGSSAWTRKAPRRDPRGRPRDRAGAALCLGPAQSGRDGLAPGGVLWTAVNERDEIGDDISPDYLVGVKEGGFYGWPYSYYGKQDPAMSMSVVICWRPR